MNLGQEGEKVAQKFLEKKGFKFIERNFKTPRWGEIDLVMRDGDTTVFVEVKARSGSSAKLFALKRAAQFYLSSKKLGQEAARIDAVSVILDDSGTAKIEHFPNITGIVW